MDCFYSVSVLVVWSGSGGAQATLTRAKWFVFTVSLAHPSTQSLARRYATTSYSLWLVMPVNRGTTTVPLLACREPVWTPTTGPYRGEVSRYEHAQVSSGLCPRFSPVSLWYSPSSVPYLKLPAGLSWHLRFWGTMLRNYSTEDKVSSTQLFCERGLFSFTLQGVSGSDPSASSNACPVTSTQSF